MKKCTVFIVFTAVFIFIFNFFSHAPKIYYISPSSGPAGTEITITGSGFVPGALIVCSIQPCPESGNKVNFNGQSAFFVPSWDGKTIKFTLFNNQPNSGTFLPGRYKLSISNTNGTSNPVNFTITSS